MTQNEPVYDQVVLKYPLELTAKAQLVELPVTARMVHFEMQRGKPTMWWLVERKGDPTQLMTTVRMFIIQGTGDPCPPEPDVLYRDTTTDGAYVWHLFEVLTP